MSTTSPFLALLGSPTTHEPNRVVVAPMVNQSELAFRLLCRRRSNVRLCFTPMMHSRLFVESLKYRTDIFDTCEEDRPVVAQFCGNDPATLLAAGKLIENRCDAIDLNLGCPQGIARRGRYGSFLLEETELLESIVKTMSTGLTVPISVKIRLVPGELENTIILCKRLEAAGAQMITVHGRYREQNKHLVGASNWDAIKAVKAAVRIPVLANGGIGTPSDVEKCMRYTGVDGVMTCEAILENPALFGTDGLNANPFEVAEEYLELARLYPNSQPKCARPHLFKFLFGTLPQHRDFFAKIGNARDLPSMLAVVKELKDMHHGVSTTTTCNDPRCGTFIDSPWYTRHREDTNDQPCEVGEGEGEGNACVMVGTMIKPKFKRTKVTLPRDEDDGGY